MITKDNVGKSVTSEGLGKGIITKFRTDEANLCYPVEVTFELPVPCGGYRDWFSIDGEYLIGYYENHFNIKLLENSNVHKR